MIQRDDENNWCEPWDGIQMMFRRIFRDEHHVWICLVTKMLVRALCRTITTGHSSFRHVNVYASDYSMKMNMMWCRGNRIPSSLFSSCTSSTPDDAYAWTFRVFDCTFRAQIHLLSLNGLSLSLSLTSLLHAPWKCSLCRGRDELGV